MFVETFGTSEYSQEELTAAVNKVFDLRPGAIIDALKLRRPIYRLTSNYGHFGREDIAVPWERLDKVGELKKYEVTS